MREDRIGTLRLKGEDAVYFINAFFNPSAEEIADHEARIDRINSSISVSRNRLGFEAEVDELDLSFLDNEQKEERLEVMVRVTVHITDDWFYSDQGNGLMQVKTGISDSDIFRECNTDDCLNIAA